ncbi:MAG: DUF924 family protein [Pseudomonadota bacterium]
MVPETTQAQLKSVVTFWFGDVAQDRPFDLDSIQMQRWYGKSEDIDAHIRTSFEDLYQTLRDAAQTDSLAFPTMTDQLAAIIVLDQFPRNMYRETPRMYESDPLALQQARHLAEHEQFGALDLFKQKFALMPFMHAEDVDAQDFMVSRFKQFPDRCRKEGWPTADFFDKALEAAVRHQEIVQRFSRFPHRNAILGRVSTQQEIEFLTEADSAF